VTIREVVHRLRTRGLVGPAYEGLVGKARLAFEELVARREVVLLAEPANLVDDTGENVGLQLMFVRSLPGLAKHADQIDAAYHPGYTARWRPAFDRGEELVLAFRGGRVAGFGWVQTGTREGIPCHYRVITTGEARILRVGVLPAFRRQGVNTAFYVLLLKELFSRGARRVYIDSSRNNLPSLRAQLRAGFRPIATILVRGSLLGGGVMRRQDVRSHAPFLLQ
jgi:ribosomal protein S18 acetylase RimI-like enzyme